MTWTEWLFVAGCTLVVFAMIGSVSLAAGAVVALFVGGAMWFMLAALSGPEEYQRRR
jgi:hypothetical protein